MTPPAPGSAQAPSPFQPQTFVPFPAALAQHQALGWGIPGHVRRPGLAKSPGQEQRQRQTACNAQREPGATQREGGRPSTR